MSYRKYINNYLIEFKDEESYLEAKLENLRLYSDIPFIGFIQNEMYDKSKCEVESIEIISTEETKINSTYTFHMNDNSSTTTNNSMWVYSNDLVVSGNISNSENFVGYANHGGTEGDFILTSGNGSNNHAIYWNDQNLYFEDNSNSPEEPIDPIDNRFDILDL